jgi:hypothetical protein
VDDPEEGLLELVVPGGSPAWSCGRTGSATALADSRVLRPTRLEMGHNRIGDRGVGELAASPVLGSATHLSWGEPRRRRRGDRPEPVPTSATSG